MDLKAMLAELKKKGYSVVETDMLQKVYDKIKATEGKKEDPKPETKPEANSFESQFNELFGKKEDPKPETKPEAKPENNSEAPEWFKTEMAKLNLGSKEASLVAEMRNGIPESNRSMFDVLSKRYTAEEMKGLVVEMGLDDPSNSGYKGTALTKFESKKDSEKLAESKLAKALNLTSSDYAIGTDEGENAFGQLFGQIIQERGANGSGAVHEGLTAGFKKFLGEE